MRARHQTDNRTISSGRHFFEEFLTLLIYDSFNLSWVVVGTYLSSKNWAKKFKYVLTHALYFLQEKIFAIEWAPLKQQKEQKKQ